MKKTALAALAIALAGTLGTGIAVSVSVTGANAAAPAKQSSVHQLAKPAFALDRARFVARMGAAFYAMDTYVLAPAKSGALASGNKTATSQAVAALTFACTQLGMAYSVAKSSSIKSLQALASDVKSLQSSCTSTAQGIKSGKITKTTIQAKVNALKAKKTSLQKKASATGVKINDVKTKISGLKYEGGSSQ